MLSALAILELPPMTPLREVTNVRPSGLEPILAEEVQLSLAASFADQILAIHRAASFAELAALSMVRRTEDTADWVVRGLSKHTDLRWSYVAERQGFRSNEARALTPQEHAVLRGIARGLTDAQIAEVLGIARRTVCKHVEAIYRKLGVETRTAAAQVCKSWNAG